MAQRQHPKPRQPLNPGKHHLRLSMVFVLAATVAIALPLSAADSFYLNLLRDGDQALSDSQFERARTNLRVACFGLLEDPVLLSQCWAQTGLAEAALDNQTGFRDSFDQLTEIERLFAGSYASADLPTEQRARYETFASRWIAEGRLIAVPAFESLAIRSAANRLARLPAESRREELKKLIAQSPGVSRWRLMLGDIYFGERRYDAAIAEADAVLAAQPSNPRARCLRGLARADAGHCAEAVEELTSCPPSRSDRPTAQTILSCQVQLARWSDSQSYYDGLPEAVRASRKISKLGRQIARGLPAADSAIVAQSGESASEDPLTENAATDNPVADTATIDSATSETAPTQRLSTDDRQTLARARQMALAATYKEDFDEILQLSSQLADDNPWHAEAQFFAGEVAYRARRWDRAIEYLSRANSTLEEDPVLLFYLSVAYFESGQEAQARQFFSRCCSTPGENPVIEKYRTRISGS